MADDIPKLFAEVEELRQIGHYDQAAVLIEKILAVDPKDGDALHCKVVCMIQDSQFEDALKLMNKNSDLRPKTVYEQAYCLFRLHKLEDALLVLDDGEESTNRSNELRAQVFYRLERYEESIALFEELTKDQKDDYSDERATNLSAAYAARAAAVSTVEALQLNTPEMQGTSYETMYNAACVQIACGSYEKALGLLEEAQVVCRNTWEQDPDITEEEIETELLLLKVQYAVALQHLGRDKEALLQYQTILKQKPEDLALVAVASNNIVALNRDHDVFDSKKKIKGATNPDLVHKLTSTQQRDIDMNQCLLFLYMNQGDACRKTCASLSKKYPDSDLPTLIKAASLAREKKYDASVSVLKEYAQKSSGDHLQLVLAQQSLSQGDTEVAIKAIDAASEALRFQPGMVGALVSLYTSQNNLEKAEQVLDGAVKYWTAGAQGEGSEKLLKVLLKATGTFKLQHKLSDRGVTAYNELVQLDPSDSRILAHLIEALAHVDLERAEDYTAGLPMEESAELSPEDVDALEAAQIVRRSRRVDTAAASLPAAPVRVKRQRKKRTRLPKNYNPNVKPDPERWIPRRERKAFAGRRKKKRHQDKEVGRGTQGSATGSQPEPVPTKVVETETPVAQPAANTPSKNNNNNKKKKKKKKR